MFNAPDIAVGLPVAQQPPHRPVLSLSKYPGVRLDCRAYAELPLRALQTASLPQHADKHSVYVIPRREVGLSLSNGPMWFPVYASAVLFGYSTSSTTAPVLAQGNTRYRGLVRPYPAGTLTLQETPSLLGAQRSRAACPGVTARLGQGAAGDRSLKCSIRYPRLT